MNNEINITAIIAIIAIIAPILLSLIDNFFGNRRYIKEAENVRNYMILDNENGLVDNYLIALGALSVQLSYNQPAIIEYRKRFYVLLPYVNEEIKTLMLSIDGLVSQVDYKNINSNVSELSRLFKKE